jgi:hypothetical protein
MEKLAQGHPVPGRRQVGQALADRRVERDPALLDE